MTTFASDWIIHTWAMVLEAAPWLLAGFLLSGAVHVLLPVEYVRRHLGTSGAASVLKAALLGIPLPLCSCSVIPVASSMRKQGASRGAFVSFLISTPETGVDSIAISYALLGPVLAVARPVAAFITAVTAGLLVGRVVEEDPPGSNGGGGNTSEDHSCCRTVEQVDDTHRTLGNKLATGLRYGLVDLFVDLSPWLISGFLLAGLVSAAMPPGFLDRHVGTGIASMLLMLVVGLPLYVCATSSTPVAAALIARGLSPGAALVFLLAGPATNVATMMLVARDAGKRGLVIYLATIGGIAVSLGLILDAFFTFLPAARTSLPDCAEHHSAASWPIGVALALLTFNGLRIRAGLRFGSGGSNSRQRSPQEQV